MMTQYVGMRVDERQVIRRLLQGVGVLLAGHLLSLVVGEHHSWQLTRIFSLDLESNIPTWFSSGLLALSALAAARCAQLARPNRHRLTWRLTALALLLLSCDEVSLFHETLNKLARKYAAAHLAVSIPPVVWPLLLGPVVLVGLVWLGRRLRDGLRGSPVAARRLVLGACLFFGGSMGLELAHNVANGDMGVQFLAVESVLEEILEILGSITILSGLLLHQRLFQTDARNQSEA